MASTFTTNKNIELPGNNDYVNTWNVPVNSDFTIIDKALGSAVSKSLSSSNITLSTSDIQNQQINLTGVLTANVTVYLPASVGGMWIVYNGTTGNYTVTFIVTGAPGTGVVCLRGASTTIYSDGTNIRNASDAIVLSIDQLWWLS